MGTGAIPGSIPGGGGTSDHGELEGLSDDDHTQYYGSGLREPDHGDLTGLSDKDHPQYVLGEDSGERIERGRIDTGSGSLGAASDGTWDTETNDNVSQSFQTAFSGGIVLATSIGEGGYITEYNNLSTTGFNIRFRYYKSSSPPGRECDWIAVGDD